MKRRTGDPWMPASDYGRSLAGLGVNLLVEDMARAIAFARTALGAAPVYADPDFAVLRGHGAEWMLHADHTYDRHPLRRRAAEGGTRGTYIVDPDGYVWVPDIPTRRPTPATS